jgi:3-hydroxyisobutyrate dehydrogenase
MAETIGFIGLGIMGHGMAHNLLKAGHSVTVWNRTASKTDEFVAAGAQAAASPAAVAASCTIIMVCVSDTPDVVAVTTGPDGILAGITPGALVIDHSTISPHTTNELAAKVNAAGAHWLDAPISGGSEGAARGTLSIMVGGDAAQFKRARPYLEAFGRTITHVGPQGAGQMVKLVNQILVVGTHLAVCEALLFAEAGGLDLNATLDAVKGGAAGSWMLANRGPQMIDRDWRPGFTIDLQQKDLRLVLQAADQLGVPLITTSRIFNLYRTLQAQGLGAEGNHALVKALEKMTGITVGSSAEG